LPSRDGLALASFSGSAHAFSPSRANGIGRLFITVDLGVVQAQSSVATVAVVNVEIKFLLQLVATDYAGNVYRVVSVDFFADAGFHDRWTPAVLAADLWFGATSPGTFSVFFRFSKNGVTVHLSVNSELHLVLRPEIGRYGLHINRGPSWNGLALARLYPLVVLPQNLLVTVRLRSIDFNRPVAIICT